MIRYLKNLNSKPLWIKNMKRLTSLKTKLESGKWIAVKYDKDWHIDKIQDVDTTDKDCLVTFMQRQK